MAFKDINPQAPVHVLIVPKDHIPSIMHIDDENGEIVKHILLIARQLAKKLNIAEKGFRIVNNCGKEGGQTVDHLHFHLLGGRNMTWPPG